MIQELFDTIVTHLRKQGKQAKDANGDCVYLTSDGLKCAVGCLIPDGHPALKAHMSNTVKRITMDYPDLPWEEEDTFFLYRMQNVHDRWDPKHWEDQFKKVAEQYTLTLEEK